MSTSRALRDWFSQWENLCVLFIAATVLILHLVIIDQVESQILDEQHYLPEARAIISGDELDNPEHPPLGKLFLALGIEVFGDNTVGWRIFPILFGVADILLFYLICRRLTDKKWLSVLATFLFAFENMCFVMSSVAMLDIFSFTFMLAAFLLYLQNRYIPSGIALALSALAKLTGAFAGGIILLHWFVTVFLIRRERNLDGVKFLIASLVVFFALMPLLDYIAMREWHYPWDRIDFMLSTSATLKFSNVDHPAISYPWEWVLSSRPQWLWYKPTYAASPNWTIWAMIIPSMVYALYGTIRRNSALTFAFIWFTGTYLVWIPIVLITDRIMFKFYFYPAVGAICLALGIGLYQILSLSLKVENCWGRLTIWLLVAAGLIGHMVTFFLMSPYCDWPAARY